MARFAESDSTRPTMTTPGPRRVAAVLLTVAPLTACGGGCEQAAAGRPPTREAPPAAFDLQRFVDAQDRVVHAPATTAYAVAIAELKAGAKREHWMWFVFPQLAGLAPNPSPMSRRYAIVSLAEARAYLADPVLGRRLAECSRLLLAQPAGGATAIFAAVDTAKLQSSMTLFSIAAGGDANPFREVLEHSFGGQFDAATVKRLADPGHRGLVQRGRGTA
jgi:uncharacterized protein (DUF1810 family)